MKWLITLVRLKFWLNKELRYYKRDSLDYKLIKQVLDKINELEGTYDKFI